MACPPFDRHECYRRAGVTQGLRWLLRLGFDPVMPATARWHHRHEEARKEGRRRASQSETRPTACFGAGRGDGHG
jgi:hypothetical protein